MILAWLLRPAHQAGNTPQLFFTTQAGGCADSACGAVRPARRAEGRGAFGPLSLHMDGAGPGSLRSARRRPERSAVSAKPVRTRRLEIRFTHDEASWIVSRARARGLSLTDYRTLRCTAR